MEALLYDTMEDKQVRCRLCNHQCLIKDGKVGKCYVRYNTKGTLKSLVYGKVVASHVDPIEKKPLFNFYPGSLSYSIATVGCNFRCRFCQNADIAQMPVDRNGLILGEDVIPQTVVDDAIKAGAMSISYTYTEPTIYFEFALETAKLASEAGLKNVFVTNGYMSIDAINLIAPYLDAANVDLKAYSENFYKKYVSAKLDAVKNTLIQMKQKGIFIEVTTLLIPGLNDDIEELTALAQFIVNKLGVDTPWHISRFHPTYKLMDRPPTPVDKLVMAREIGIKQGLRYVYTGNVLGEKGESTFCYQCGKLLIERWGYQIRKNNIKNSTCPYCQVKIDGVCLDNA